MKVLCITWPHFPLHCEMARNARLKGQACLVVQETGSLKTVLDYSPEMDGLRPGLALQEALSRHDGCAIIQANLPYYCQRFYLILDALERVSPVVEGAELGLAYLSMDGMEGIYPDDEALVAAVREAILLPGPHAALVAASRGGNGGVNTPPHRTSGSLPSQGWERVRIGISTSKFLAHLAARQCPVDASFRSLSGDVAGQLKDQSCDILPISAKNLKKLREFGLRTLGQIAALPPGPLLSQFGREGKRIWQLAHGEDSTPLHPRSLEEAIEESATLSWVTVSVEALISIVESLLAAALAKSDLRGRGIACLMVWTRGQDARHWEKTINYKEPAMDVKSALPRARYFLENCPQPGPVEQVGIKITRLGYGAGRQKSIFAEVRARDHLLDEIKELELRLAGPQIYEVKEIEPWSRIPERRYALAPLNR